MQTISPHWELPDTGPSSQSSADESTFAASSFDVDSLINIRSTIASRYSSRTTESLDTKRDLGRRTRLRFLQIESIVKLELGWRSKNQSQ